MGMHRVQKEADPWTKAMDKDLTWAWPCLSVWHYQQVISNRDIARNRAMDRSKCDKTTHVMEE
jgi:hypothetical protein